MNISPQNMTALISFFSGVPKKAKIEIWADQVSGVAPFPNDFYKALKDGGWPMAEAGVHPYMRLSTAGRVFQGAILSKLPTTEISLDEVERIVI